MRRSTPSWHLGAGTEPGGWRAVVVAAALGTAAPVHAAPAQTQTGHVYAWISDGWGGGTLTSNPAGINCHATAWDPYSEDSPPPNGPDPAHLTVASGYHPVYVIFCPDDGLCMSY